MRDTAIYKMGNQDSAGTMCHWRSWIWPGVTGVALMSAFAWWMTIGSIETDLQAKAERLLVASGYEWAEVEVSGRQAILRGEASSESDRAGAALAIRTVTGIVDVDNQASLPDESSLWLAPHSFGKFS